MIDRAQITRVYSGRPGCMCGCRGNYSESHGAITRIVNRINKVGEGEKRMSVMGVAFYYVNIDNRILMAYSK